jgi:hypothetical protein
MIAGFICEKTGDPTPYEDCIECARTRVNRKLNCPFDEATLVGMILNQKRKDEITVTKLSSCPRSVFIDRHFDHFVYPSDMYWAFRGQIAHKIMEEAHIHEDAIAEQRFEREWEGIKISGTPDLILPQQRVLKDFKTSKAVPSYKNKDGVILAYENHRVQVNTYRWLVKPNYEIAELEIVYFSMEETLLCPVEVWPDEAKRKTDMTIDRYLEERLVPLKMALDSGTMPPYARTWSCDGYCGVSEICHKELKKEILAARKVVKLKKGDKANVRSSNNTKRGSDANNTAVYCR